MGMTFHEVLKLSIVFINRKEFMNLELRAYEYLNCVYVIFLKKCFKQVLKNLSPILGVLRKIYEF